MSTPKQEPWARSAVGTVRPLAVASGKRLGPIIYELIKKRLLEGAYAAGERIDIEALRAEFDVSRQPVMEAMRRLASEGLVEIVPQVGCRVPVYTASDVEDFFTMFAVMEGSVAGVAAERHRDAELAALEDANRQIADLAAVPDPARRSHGYRVLNREFHVSINGMAHSAVIADISRRMWDMTDLLINTAGVTQPLAGAIRGRNEDHNQIIAAIRNRDAISARAEMERHILGTIAIIRSEAAS
jgi:DNA-binding GntR family transcriptional regulator